MDLDGPALAHGRELARRRGLEARVDLVEGDAEAVSPAQATALICVGASQIWGPDVSENQPVDCASALAALRPRVPRGGRVLYGEGIWTSPPTAAAIAPLAGRGDEFVAIPELVELAVGHGFMPVAVEQASLDEWDAFESRYGAGRARWLAAHPSDHPDAAAVSESARRQRESYLGGYRGVLGMAYPSLLAV